MKISEFVVQGLFDRFDHHLRFNPNEHITIITSPNGYGKTMILRIINAMFNLPVRSLERIPFRHLSIGFEDGSKLQADRVPAGREPHRGSRRYQLTLTYSPRNELPEYFTPTDEISEDRHQLPGACH